MKWSHLEGKRIAAPPPPQLLIENQASHRSKQPLGGFLQGLLTWRGGQGEGGGGRRVWRLGHRLVTGEGDVELAVVRQAEGLADGLRELLVPIRPRPHLNLEGYSAISCGMCMSISSSLAGWGRRGGGRDGVGNCSF